MSSSVTLSVPFGTVIVPVLTALSVADVESGRPDVVEAGIGTVEVDDDASTDDIDTTDG
jgi:hypothetical protein